MLRQIRLTTLNGQNSLHDSWKSGQIKYTLYGQVNINANQRELKAKYAGKLW